MEYERELAERIVQRIEEAGARGLSLEELAGSLRSEGWRLSDRRMQELLQRLEEEGRIARRLERGGRGRPRTRYVSPSAALGPLFDRRPPRLIPKDLLPDYRRAVIPAEELERLEEEYGWIGRTALEHAMQEDVARALWEAALELAGADPRELLLEMARWMMGRLRQIRRELLGAIHAKDGREMDRRIRELEEWTRFARRFFVDTAGLPLPRHEEDEDWAIRIELDRRKWRDPDLADEKLFGLREDRAREELGRRVLGEAVVEIAPLGGGRVEAFAATDASVANLEVKVRGRGAMEQPEEIQIFSSAAALQLLPRGSRPPPLLDFDIDPEIFRRVDELEAFRRGLAIFPAAAEWMGLTEGRLSHARGAALDLRQYRRDADVMDQRVQWRRARLLRSLDLRVPQILFRDGRLLPSNHQIGLYEDPTPYGDLVRHQILAAARAAHAARIMSCAYVGVVKTPELHFLAPLAFWHAVARRRDPRVNERMILRPRMGDPLVAFILLAARGREARGGLAFTFRLLRRFSDIADLRRFYIVDGGKRRPVRPDRPEDWEKYFDQYVEWREGRHREGEDHVPPLPREDYQAFAELCQRFAVLQFFMLRIGQGEREPRPVLLPRYEVLTDPSDPARPLESQWGRALELLRAWAADPEAFELDEEHDPSLQRPDREALRIPLLLPRAVVEAHRAASGAAEELRTETERLLLKALEEAERILARRRR